MIENLYIIVTVTLLLSAVMVMLSFNPIQSAFFLVLTYVSAVVQLLLFKVEFIALVLMTVYIGAIIVLLLFVILMIDIKHLEVSYFYYSIMLSFIFLIETLFLVFKNFKLNTYFFNNFFLTNFFRNWALMIDTTIDIEILGLILSVNFVIHLLITGLILFLGIVSAVFLTLNFKTQNTKLQITFRQLSKNFSKSLI